MLDFHPTLLWVDMEMSGLDPIKNRIIEFACILSDAKLTHFSEGPHLIIHCDEDHLNSMDQWNTEYLFFSSQASYQVRAFLSQSKKRSRTRWGRRDDSELPEIAGHRERAADYRR